MKLVFFMIGAAIGLLVVRGFMFNGVEEIAWRVFWRMFHLFWLDVLKGKFGTIGMEEVMQSMTFTKVIIGMGVGGLLGLLAAPASK